MAESRYSEIWALYEYTKYSVVGKVIWNFKKVIFLLFHATKSGTIIIFMYVHLHHSTMEQKHSLIRQIIPGTVLDSLMIK